MSSGGIGSDIVNERLKNGYITEEIFVVECLKNKIPVSKPIVNVQKYDFIIEVNNKTYRIQVKKGFKQNSGFIVELRNTSTRANGKKRVSLSRVDNVDFLAVLCEKEWFIIPFYEIKDIRSNISINKNTKYYKYKDNWSLIT